MFHRLVRAHLHFEFHVEITGVAAANDRDEPNILQLKALYRWIP